MLQKWFLNGLPKDEQSIMNATIIENSNKYFFLSNYNKLFFFLKRWNLLIDPQGQGLQFLNNYSTSLNK